MKNNFRTALLACVMTAGFVTSAFANQPTFTKTNLGNLIVFYDQEEDTGSVHFTGGPEEIIDGTYRLLFINGYAIDGADVITREDRTLVPIRMVSENLGCAVDWDGNKRMVTIEKEGIKIEMTIDKKNVKVNGSADILDVAPIIYRDRTYLPLRFVSEKLNAYVGYYDNKSGNTQGLINRIPQVTIDEKYEDNVKEISKTEAKAQIKKALKESFDLNKTNINQEDISYIEKSIENVSHNYDISRYYVFTGLEGIYDIVFDKYTGDMYKKTFVQIQSISDFKADDVTNFVLAG